MTHPRLRCYAEPLIAGLLLLSVGAPAHAWQDAVAIANEAKSIVNDAKKAADAAVTSSAEAAKQAAEAAKQAAEAAKQAAEAAKQAAEAMKKLTQAVHELKKGEDDARKAAPGAPETITGEFDIPDGDLDGLITRLKQRGWRIQPGDSSKAEKLIATLPKSTAPSYTTCLTVQSTWVCSSPLVITQYVYPQVYAIPRKSTAWVGCAVRRLAVKSCGNASWISTRRAGGLIGRTRSLLPTTGMIALSLFRPTHRAPCEMLVA